MRGRIEWTTTRTVQVGSHAVPIAAELTARQGGGGVTEVSGGLRTNTPRQMRVKSVLYPLVLPTERFLGHKFIHPRLAARVRPLLGPDAVFLECGCGDMHFRRYLPADLTYNAIEYSMSEFHLRRVLRSDPRANICLASAEAIPVRDGTCSVVVSIEVLPEVPDAFKALAEIRRVLRLGGHLVCSVSNGFSVKAQRRGINPGFFHRWSSADFRGHVERAGFEVVEHFQLGKWIPLPKALTGRSLHLATSSPREEDNSYFGWVLRARG